jgi:hypothetical protein
MRLAKRGYSVVGMVGARPESIAVHPTAQLGREHVLNLNLK